MSRIEVSWERKYLQENILLLTNENGGFEEVQGGQCAWSKQKEGRAMRNAVLCMAMGQVLYKICK